MDSICGAVIPVPSVGVLSKPVCFLAWHWVPGGPCPVGMAYERMGVGLDPPKPGAVAGYMYTGGTPAYVSIREGDWIVMRLNKPEVLRPDQFAEYYEEMRS